MASQNPKLLPVNKSMIINCSFHRRMRWGGGGGGVVNKKRTLCRVRVRNINQINTWYTWRLYVMCTS